MKSEFRFTFMYEKLPNSGGDLHALLQQKLCSSG